MSLNDDIKTLITSMGLELYDTNVVNENGENIFRVDVVSAKIDENGKRVGVSLDECVELTQLLSPMLDVTPPMQGKYRLEVGSAGLEKKIKTLEQFKLCVGEDVSLVLQDKTKLKAKLIKTDGKNLTFKNDEGVFDINFDEIKKARTYFQW